MKHLNHLVRCSSCNLPACVCSKLDIQEIDSLMKAQDELSNADTATLIIFDMDDTLLVPSEKICYLDYRETNDFDPADRDFVTQMRQNLKKLFDAQNSPTYQIKLFSSVWGKMHFSPVEPTSVFTIRQLQARGAKVVALTAINTGKFGAIENMQEWRLDNLREVGLDFGDSFTTKEISFEHLTPHNDNPPVYYHGILCSAGSTKGKVLAAFLDSVDFKPSKILFFDDVYKHCISVADEMKKSGIAVQCYHYRAAYKEKIKFNQAVVQHQFDHWVKHEEFLTEEEALSIIGNSSSNSAQAKMFYVNNY